MKGNALWRNERQTDRRSVGSVKIEIERATGESPNANHPAIPTVQDYTGVEALAKSRLSWWCCTAVLKPLFISTGCMNAMPRTLGGKRMHLNGMSKHERLRKSVEIGCVERLDEDCWSERLMSRFEAPAESSS